MRNSCHRCLGRWGSISLLGLLLSCIQPTEWLFWGPPSSVELPQIDPAYGWDPRIVSRLPGDASYPTVAPDAFGQLWIIWLGGGVDCGSTPYGVVLLRSSLEETWRGCLRDLLHLGPDTIAWSTGMFFGYDGQLHFVLNAADTLHKQAFPIHYVQTAPLELARVSTGPHGYQVWKAQVDRFGRLWTAAVRYGAKKMGFTVLLSEKGDWRVVGGFGVASGAHQVAIDPHGNVHIAYALMYRPVSWYAQINERGRIVEKLTLPTRVYEWSATLSADSMGRVFATWKEVDGEGFFAFRTTKTGWSRPARIPGGALRILPLTADTLLVFGSSGLTYLATFDTAGLHFFQQIHDRVYPPSWSEPTFSLVHDTLYLVWNAYTPTPLGFSRQVFLESLTLPSSP